MIDREKDWKEILSNPKHDHCDSYTYQLAMQFGNEGQAFISWLNFIGKKRTREEYCRIIVHGNETYREKAWDVLLKMTVPKVNLRYLVRRAPQPWAGMAWRKLIDEFSDEDMRLILLASFYNDQTSEDAYKQKAINLIMERSNRPCCFRTIIDFYPTFALQAWATLKELKISGPELCKLWHITRKKPELTDMLQEIEERIVGTSMEYHIRGYY